MSSDEKNLTPVPFGNPTGELIKFFLFLLTLLFSLSVYAEKYKPIEMYVATAKEKNTLVKVLGNDAVGEGKYRLILGRADFNNDHVDDSVVVVESSYACGSGGCATYLVVMSKKPSLYVTNSTFLNNTGQFAVGTKTHNGLKTLVTMNKGKVALGDKAETPLYGKPLEYEFHKQEY